MVPSPLRGARWGMKDRETGGIKKKTPPEHGEASFSIGIVPRANAGAGFTTRPFPGWFGFNGPEPSTDLHA